MGRVLKKILAFAVILVVVMSNVAFAEGPSTELDSQKGNILEEDKILQEENLSDEVKELEQKDREDKFETRSVMVTITFKSGENGSLLYEDEDGNEVETNEVKVEVMKIVTYWSDIKVPTPKPADGYVFDTWEPSIPGDEYPVNSSETYVAMFIKAPPQEPEPNFFIAGDDYYTAYIGGSDATGHVFKPTGEQIPSYGTVNMHYYEDGFDENTLVAIKGEDRAFDIAGLKAMYDFGNGEYKGTDGEWWYYVTDGPDVAPPSDNDKEWYENGYEAQGWKKVSTIGSEYQPDVWVSGINGKETWPNGDKDDEPPTTFDWIWSPNWDEQDDDGNDEFDRTVYVRNMNPVPNYNFFIAGDDQFTAYVDGASGDVFGPEQYGVQSFRKINKYYYDGFSENTLVAIKGEDKQWQIAGVKAMYKYMDNGQEVFKGTKGKMPYYDPDGVLHYQEAVEGDWWVYVGETPPVSNNGKEWFDYGYKAEGWVPASSIPHDKHASTWVDGFVPGNKLTWPNGDLDTNEITEFEWIWSRNWGREYDDGTDEFDRIVYMRNMDPTPYFNFFISGDDTYKVYIDDTEAEATSFKVVDPAVPGLQGDDSWPVPYKIEGREPQPGDPHEKNYRSLNMYEYDGSLSNDTFVAIKGWDTTGQANVAGVKAMYKYLNGNGEELYSGTDETWYYHMAEIDSDGNLIPPLDDADGKKWYEEAYKGVGWLPVTTIPIDAPAYNNGDWNDNWPNGLADEDNPYKWIWSDGFDVPVNPGDDEFIDTPMFLRSAKPDEYNLFIAGDDHYMAYVGGSDAPGHVFDPGGYEEDSYGSVNAHFYSPGFDENTLVAIKGTDTAQVVAGVKAMYRIDNPVNGSYEYEGTDGDWWIYIGEEAPIGNDGTTKWFEEGYEADDWIPATEVDSINDRWLKVGNPILGLAPKEWPNGDNDESNPIFKWIWSDKWEGFVPNIDQHVYMRNMDPTPEPDYNFFISGDDTYKVYIDGSEAQATNYMIENPTPEPAGSDAWPNPPLIEGRTPDWPDDTHEKNYKSLNMYEYDGGFANDTFIAIKAKDSTGCANVAGVKAMYKYVDGNGEEKYSGTDATWWYHLGSEDANGNHLPPSDDANGNPWYAPDYEASGWIQVTEIPIDGPAYNNGAWNDNWPNGLADADNPYKWIWSEKFDVPTSDSIDTPVYLRSAKPIEKNFFIAGDDYYTAYIGGSNAAGHVFEPVGEEIPSYGSINEHFYADGFDANTLVAIKGEDRAYVIAGLKAMYKYGNDEFEGTDEDWWYYVTDGPNVAPPSGNGKEWYEYGYEAPGWQKVSTIPSDEQHSSWVSDNGIKETWPNGDKDDEPPTEFDWIWSPNWHNGSGQGDGTDEFDRTVYVRNMNPEPKPDYDFFISGDDTYKVYIDGSEAQATNYMIENPTPEPAGSDAWPNPPLIEGRTPDWPDDTHEKNYKSLNMYEYDGSLSEDTFVAIKAEDSTGSANVAGVKAMYKYIDGNGEKKYKGTDHTWWYHLGGEDANGNHLPPSDDANNRKWYDPDYQGTGWLPVTEIPIDGPAYNNGAWNDNWPNGLADADNPYKWIWSEKFDVPTNNAIDTPVYLRSMPANPGTFDLTVKKKWFNADGTPMTDGIPGAISFKLLKDGVAYEYEGNTEFRFGPTPPETWNEAAYVFKDIPYGNYTLEEIAVWVDTDINNISSYDVSYDYDSTKDTFFNINTKKGTGPPPEYTYLEVEKEWRGEDGSLLADPPLAEVEVELIKDGIATGITAVLNDGNSWKHRFDNLIKYRPGTMDLIVYTVRENTTVPGYSTSIVYHTEDFYALITNKRKPATGGGGDIEQPGGNPPPPGGGEGGGTEIVDEVPPQDAPNTPDLPDIPDAPLSKSGGIPMGAFIVIGVGLAGLGIMAKKKNKK